MTTVVAVLGAAILAGSLLAQGAVQAPELAAYRLTPDAFDQFERASRGIASLLRTDAALQIDPLFTRDVLVLGDAVEAAQTLEARLLTHVGLSARLRAAHMTARDYTKFALALFAARLAHGFVAAGVIRMLPPGAASENVKFIEEHRDRVAALLQDLGVEASH